MAARMRCTVQVCTIAWGQVASIASGNPVSPMPLWMSSRVRALVGGCRRGLGCDEGEDLAGDVALEAADRLAAGFALGEASLQVVLGAGIPAQPGQGDPVERGVGLAVTAAVGPQPLGLAGGRFDGAGSAERSVGALAAQSLGARPPLGTAHSRHRTGGVGSGML